MPKSEKAEAGLPEVVEALDTLNDTLDNSHISLISTFLEYVKEGVSGIGGTLEEIRDELKKLNKNLEKVAIQPKK